MGPPSPGAANHCTQTHTKCYSPVCFLAPSYLQRHGESRWRTLPAHWQMMIEQHPSTRLKTTPGSQPEIRAQSHLQHTGSTSSATQQKVCKATFKGPSLGPGMFSVLPHSGIIVSDSLEVLIILAPHPQSSPPHSGSSLSSRARVGSANLTSSIMSDSAAVWCGSTRQDAPTQSKQAEKQEPRSSPITMTADGGTDRSLELTWKHFQQRGPHPGIFYLVF